MACLEGCRKSRSESIGSCDAYRDLHVPSSVDLLRASIVRSIRERAYENQGFLERKFDGSDRKAEHYHGPKYSVVEVSSSNSLEDAESDLSDTERKDTTNERKTQFIQRTNSSERNIEQSTASHELENSLSIHSDQSNIQNSNKKETPDDSLVIKDNKDDDFKDQRSTEMNNFILARRKFNSSLFEDCSTYDITCSTLLLSEVNDKCSQLSQPHPQNHTALIHTSSPTENISLCSTKDCSSLCSDKNESTRKSSFTDVYEHADDHTALCDTFFTHVVSGEQSTPNAFYQNNRPITDGRSSLEEKDLNSVEPTEGEVVNHEPSALPAKRKFSRRHRKRSRRKPKSKKSYVYECSKCGVSYFIATKAMNNVACCLHCDLWTPVEPVFVKREKTSWNSCRVS